MDKKSINNLREFRCSCYWNNTIFTKVSVDSFAECKCKKCKKLHYFNLGTTFCHEGAGVYKEYIAINKKKCLNRNKKGGSLKL